MYRRRARRTTTAILSVIVCTATLASHSLQAQEQGRYPLPTAGQRRSDTIITPSGEEQEVEVQRESESEVQIGGRRGRQVEVGADGTVDSTEELIEAFANATGLTEAIVGDDAGRATYQDEIETDSFGGFVGSFLDSDYMDGGVIDSGLSELSDRDNPFRTMVELSQMTEEEREREDQIYATEQAATLGILIAAGVVYAGIDAYGTPKATYTIDQSFHNNMYRATFDGLGNDVPRRGYSGVDFGVGIERVYANERWGLDNGHTLFTLDLGWGLYRGDLDSVRWERSVTRPQPNPLVPETIAEGRRREQYQWRFTPIAGRFSFGGTLSGGDIFSSVKYTRRIGSSRWAFTAGTEVVWYGGRRANYLSDGDLIGFPTGILRLQNGSVGYGASSAWENDGSTDYRPGVMQAYGASWPLTFTIGFTFGLPSATLRSQRVDPEMSLYTPLQGVAQ